MDAIVVSFDLVFTVVADLIACVVLWPYADGRGRA